MSSSLQDSALCSSQWMVSACPQISKSSRPFTKPLGIVPRASITIGITVTFIFHSFFLVLWQDSGTYLSFRFLLFLLCGSPRRQSSLFARFFFLFFSFFFFFF